MNSSTKSNKTSPCLTSSYSSVTELIMISIYWLLDMSDATHPQGRPFYVGAARDPDARLHKLLTDAWHRWSPRDRRIDDIGISNVRLHVVAQMRDTSPWRARLASSIATVKHCWPDSCNVALKSTGGPRAAAPKPSKSKKGRFRFHRRAKRPAPGAPAPRGSFRSDGTAPW